MQKFSLTRREMLSGVTAVGVLAASGTVSTTVAAANSIRVPGVQLYTVRDAMAKDVAATLQAVAGIGYREVEFAGYFDLQASEIRRLLEQFNLSSPSAHVDARVMRDDPLPTIEAAATVGHDYATVAWLQPEDRQTLDDYRRWADVLNRSGEVCREHGLRIAYHNHDFEFEQLDGGIPFDVLLERTEADLVDFEMDFYWVRKADREILDVLGKAPQRITMAHIKDMGPAGEMVDVGAGTIDFSDILAHADAAGIRHCFVEHDEPEDPFQSVAFSHYALQEILR